MSGEESKRSEQQTDADAGDGVAAYEDRPPDNSLRQKQTLLRQESASFQGPLPPPSYLEHYAEVYPDAPRVIFSLVQEQSDHRRHLESKHLHHSIIRAYMGLVAALLVAFAGLGAAVYIAVEADPAAGAVVASIDLVGLVGVFVYGTRQIQADRQSKQRKEEEGEEQQTLFD